jgi:hypothetical protein
MPAARPNRPAARPNRPATRSPAASVRTSTAIRPSASRARSGAGSGPGRRRGPRRDRPLCSTRPCLGATARPAAPRPGRCRDRRRTAAGGTRPPIRTNPRPPNRHHDQLTMTRRSLRRLAVNMRRPAPTGVLSLLSHTPRPTLMMSHRAQPYAPDPGICHRRSWRPPMCTRISTTHVPACTIYTVALHLCIARRVARLPGLTAPLASPAPPAAGRLRI